MHAPRLTSSPRYVYKKWPNSTTLQMSPSKHESGNPTSQSNTSMIWLATAVVILVSILYVYMLTFQLQIEMPVTEGLTEVEASVDGRPTEEIDPQVGDNLLRLEYQRTSLYNLSVQMQAHARHLKWCQYTGTYFPCPCPCGETPPPPRRPRLIIDPALFAYQTYNVQVI